MFQPASCRAVHSDNSIIQYMKAGSEIYENYEYRTTPAITINTKLIFVDEILAICINHHFV